jgi:DNA-binding HxlR family transcriptional regulator
VDETPRSGCPLNAAVEVLGDRWTLIVLRDVMFADRRHFRTLLRESEEGIASNILANRLHRLVDEGLLTRDEPGPGRRATYSLTEAAIELLPILNQLSFWGTRHRPSDPELRARSEEMFARGPAGWQAFADDLRERHLASR